MINKMAWLLLAAAASLVGSQGCTYRACMKDLRRGNARNVTRISSQSEVQKCLDSVNSTTYDDYARSRKESNK